VARYNLEIGGVEVEQVVQCKGRGLFFYGKYLKMQWLYSVVLKCFLATSIGSVHLI